MSCLTKLAFGYGSLQAIKEASMLGRVLGGTAGGLVGAGGGGLVGASYDMSQMKDVDREWLTREHGRLSPEEWKKAFRARRKADPNFITPTGTYTGLLLGGALGALTGGKGGAAAARLISKGKTP